MKKSEVQFLSDIAQPKAFLILWYLLFTYEGVKMLESLQCDTLL